MSVGVDQAIQKLADALGTDPEFILQAYISDVTASGYVWMAVSIIMGLLLALFVVVLWRGIKRIERSDGDTEAGEAMVICGGFMMFVSSIIFVCSVHAWVDDLIGAEGEALRRLNRDIAGYTSGKCGG